MDFECPDKNNLIDKDINCLVNVTRDKPDATLTISFDDGTENQTFYLNGYY